MKMGGVAVTVKPTEWQHGVLWVGIWQCTGIILDIQCLVTLTSLGAALDAMVEHCFVLPERGKPRPKAKKLLVPCAVAGLAWPCSGLVVPQRKVVQLQAVKTWGFPGLAASQQSSLMHETEQVTYSEHCMGLFLMHALGTRKRYVPWKHSVCTLLFSRFWGVCVENTERDSSMFKTVFL